MALIGTVPISLTEATDSLAGPTLHQIRDYLGTLIEGFRSESNATPRSTSGETPDRLVDQVFSTLTSRKFSYLGRRRATLYRRSILTSLKADIQRGQSLQFFYDIGPGYHASLRPGIDGLNFTTGLSELLLLGQVNGFIREVTGIYPAGVKFQLVIDNVCGLETNDVPLRDTESYCSKLRRLIRELGIQHHVDLLVESELPHPIESKPESESFDAPMAPVSTDEKENVERFLGRHCSVAESAHRIVRYQSALQRSEERFAPYTRGVRMTQRATETNIGFRSFPGGDSRIQCGQVALRLNAKGRIQPFLLTSRNIAQYKCERMRFSDILSGSIEHVIFARAKK